jgi:hypothetical protein
MALERMLHELDTNKDLATTARLIDCTGSARLMLTLEGLRLIYERNK